jgi:hypothetical protein
MIDAVSPDNPVMLVDMSGHNLLLNSAGMRFCNITDENFKDMVRCYLSPEQFMAIQIWFFNNRDEINSNWNMGVEDDPKA